MLREDTVQGVHQPPLGDDAATTSNTTTTTDQQGSSAQLTFDVKDSSNLLTCLSSDSTALQEKLGRARNGRFKGKSSKAAKVGPSK
jgi:hypothetical protein